MFYCTTTTNVHMCKYLKIQGMLSFSLMMLPSLESNTAKVSPSAFFFKNFLRPVTHHRTLKLPGSAKQDVVTESVSPKHAFAGCLHRLLRDRHLY